MTTRTPVSRRVGRATGFACATAASNAADTARAVDECLAALHDEQSTEFDWLLVSYTEHHDATRIAERLHAASNAPGAIHGASSCRAVMTENGVHDDVPSSLAVFAVRDPEGAYGVGSAVIGDDPRAAAARAVDAALERAGRHGEPPALIWMSAAPGHEEELLRGIADLVGANVPVAGGSAADDTVAGGWSQLAGAGGHDDAVVVSALFPSVELSFAFHSGYDATTTRGTVTRAHDRTIEEIDGEPAAHVYDRWTEGSISEVLEAGGNVLGLTSLAPLGRVVDDESGLELYTLSHPCSVEADGSLTLFTEATVGSELVLMTGSEENLVRRAGRVARSARESGDADGADVLGGLVIYCAGCMLTITDRMPRVVGELNEALDHAPYVGSFTFGEQGCHVGNQNAHGNLMISVVLFRDEEAL